LSVEADLRDGVTGGEVAFDLVKGTEMPEIL